NSRNNSVIFIDLTSSNDEPESNNPVASASKPCTLNVLSWNIDGLDQSNFTARLQTIVSYLRKDLPHVVCFQEVVSTSLEFFRSELAESYDIFSATDDPFADCIHYFVAILIRKHPALIVDRSSFTVSPFPHTSMGRQVISVDLCIHFAQLNSTLSANSPAATLRLRVFTAHLESSRDGADYRKAQLRQVWSKMSLLESAASKFVSAEPQHIPQASIFCGDLNLRDSEVRELGGLPNGISDAWEASGSRPELRITWDPVRNSNAGRFSKYVPKKSQSHGCRYDRMYWCGKRLRAVDFGLHGLERVPRCSCFPSDHWGILGRFVAS
ncbi:hypothetical protein EG68_07873, partial [Paragonimus skrjabini miyazakii]